MERIVMKQRTAMSVVLVLLLCLTACDAAPEVTVPESSHSEGTHAEDTYDLVYNMNDYGWFSEIFDEKPYDQWDAMGRYTMLLEGLAAPMTVEMDGRNVLSVSAYGYAVDVNIGLFQDDTPADIRSTADAIVINEDLDYDGSTWILTADGCYEFHPEGDISTQIRVDADGAMRYRRYWGEYDTAFNQDDYAPLYQCTGRDHFLYETGRAEIADGEVILTAEKTVTVSDEFDLDAMFTQAKSEGLFAEYDSVDALLDANKARAENN